MTWLIFSVVMIGAAVGSGYLVGAIILGRKAASRNVRYGLPWLLMGFALAFVFATLMRWQRPSSDLFSLAYVMVVLTWLLSWPVRRQDAGEVLLNAGRTLQHKLLFWIGILEVGVAIYFTWPSLIVPVRSVEYISIPQIVFWWVFAIFFLVLGLSQLELRENGFCFMYTFVRWQRIKSYAWEPSRPNTLTIQVKPYLPLMPGFISITVPSSHRDAVEQIVAAHFSDAAVS